MSAPSGYTALDFVGFTDKGTYSPSATYMRNDLVHYGGNIMRCLIDNTTNVTPVVGANWELWVGASANLVERVIAPLENNPADVAYGVGRQIIYDDWLWEVIAPIAVGDALVDYAVDPINANIKKSAPVETQLLAVKAEADATDNMIAPTETNASSSSAAYAVGDQLILNNVLYTVTTAITIGDALVSGTGGNIEASDNLTDQLADKVDSSDLGTAAAKDSTNAVTQNSTDLVESGAVYSEVNTVKQALTKTTDSIAITNDADTNTQGQVIPKGTRFYKNGVLCRALSDIAVGGTLTLNSNYAVTGTITNQLFNAKLFNGALQQINWFNYEVYYMTNMTYDSTLEKYTKEVTISSDIELIAAIPFVHDVTRTDLTSSVTPYATASNNTHKVTFGVYRNGTDCTQAVIGCFMLGYKTKNVL